MKCGGDDCRRHIPPCPYFLRLCLTPMIPISGEYLTHVLFHQLFLFAGCVFQSFSVVGLRMTLGSMPEPVNSLIARAHGSLNMHNTTTEIMNNFHFPPFFFNLPPPFVSLSPSHTFCGASSFLYLFLFLSLLTFLHFHSQIHNIAAGRDFSLFSVKYFGIHTLILSLQNTHFFSHSFIQICQITFIMHLFSYSIFFLVAVSATPHSFHRHNHLSHPHITNQKRSLTPDNTCGGANGYICNPSDSYGGSCCSAAGWCGELSSSIHWR